MSKSDVRFYEVHQSLGEVTEKVRLEVEGRQDPLAAVLNGVDVGWEVCLLKFMLDMAMASGGLNLQDFTAGRCGLPEQSPATFRTNPSPAPAGSAATSLPMSKHGLTVLLLPCGGLSTRHFLSG